MSLDNLVGISLERIDTDKFTITRLLAAAQRNISDAGIEALSAENRFDIAYKAILQVANAALRAHGYRTLTSKPGHHATMLQSLHLTLGLDKQSLIVLDALRKQRQVVDYSGDLVPEGTVETCVKEADDLLRNVYEWLQTNKPELLPE